MTYGATLALQYSFTLTFIYLNLIPVFLMRFIYLYLPGCIYIDELHANDDELTAEADKMDDTLLQLDNNLSEKNLKNIRKI